MKKIERTNNNNPYLKNYSIYPPTCIIYIMLRKIILPLVLLIFTQQNFYGMQVEQEGANEDNDIKKHTIFGMEWTII